jgi:uncharacterized protein
MPVPSPERRLSCGISLIETGDFFAAHEVLEEAWREAPETERDFFQGLVHVAVAWYQAGRGNRVGCERQLVKAARRLSRYAPSYRGLDVAGLVAQLEAVRYPELPPPFIRYRGTPACG